MSDAAQVLSEWQDKLAIITRNANELYEAEFSKRIRNRLREGRYSGLTAVRAEAAVAKLTALMDDYLVLARVVEEATEANRGSLFVARETTDAKVLELLLGYSVALPAVHVPLPSRDLLTEANAAQRARPAELLHAMQLAFAEARDSLNAIDQAERSLQQQTSDIQEAARKLADEAVSLGADGSPPQINAMLENRTDPLQALQQIDNTRREIDAWQRKLQALAKERDSALAAMAKARAGIASLAEAETARINGLAVAQALFGGAASDAAPAALVQGKTDLRQWLATLEKTLTEKRWAAAKMGLARLQTGLDTLIATADAARTAACKDVAEYEDIKARFKVLRIKAERLALNEPSVAALAAEVQAQYRARPVDMQALRTRIKAYEARLLALQSQAGNGR
jgi:hypothetical protein